MTMLLRALMRVAGAVVVNRPCDGVLERHHGLMRLARSDIAAGNAGTSPRQAICL